MRVSQNIFKALNEKMIINVVVNKSFSKITSRVRARSRHVGCEQQH